MPARARAVWRRPLAALAAAAAVAVAVFGGYRHRQLAGTDVWLIDKSPVGTTRSQHLVLRGQFGRPQAFFFDDIPGGDRSLDLFGEVLAVVAADGAVDLEVNAQRRRTKYADRAGITSHLHLSPEDTAAVELPIGSPG